MMAMTVRNGIGRVVGGRNCSMLRINSTKSRLPSSWKGVLACLRRKGFMMEEYVCFVDADLNLRYDDDSGQ